MSCLMEASGKGGVVCPGTVPFCHPLRLRFAPQTMKQDSSSVAGPKYSHCHGGKAGSVDGRERCQIPYLLVSRVKQSGRKMMRQVGVGAGDGWMGGKEKDVEVGRYLSSQRRGRQR
jgi:hypothetical protein